MFLIFGGSHDFNIKALVKQLANKKVEHFPILLAEDKIPGIVWDLMSNKLLIDNQSISPSAVFLRNDVFNSVKFNSSTSYTWFKTLKEWAFTQEHVSVFNQQYIGMNKSYNLMLAKKIGFNIPYTIITNQTQLFNRLEHPKEHIIKPVIGGQYTISLEKFMTAEKNKKEKHSPLMYLQNRLLQPEMRIFGIGTRFFAFHVISDQLDYRVDTNTKVVEIEVTKDLSNKLSLLMQKLKLDFAAADFKTCPKTGKLLFLEINSGPMFGKFDAVSKGKICSAIIDWHLQ